MGSRWTEKAWASEKARRRRKRMAASAGKKEMGQVYADRFEIYAEFQAGRKKLGQPYNHEDFIACIFYGKNPGSVIEQQMPAELQAMLQAEAEDDTTILLGIADGLPKRKEGESAIDFPVFDQRGAIIFKNVQQAEWQTEYFNRCSERQKDQLRSALAATIKVADGGIVTQILPKEPSIEIDDPFAGADEGQGEEP